MLPKEEILFITNHLSFLSKHADASKPTITINNDLLGQNGIKLNQFKQKLRGTNNKLLFDNNAVLGILNALDKC